MKTFKKFIGIVLFAVVVLSPVFLVMAASNTTNPSSGTSIVNPLGTTQTLQDLIFALVILATKLGAVVCVFFIIYAGFLFVKAQGDPAELTKAKSVLLWSVVGAAVLLGASVMSAAICETVKSVLGNGSALNCSVKR